MSSDFDVLKNSVVTEMFVDTADQNYLIARWAYHRGLFIDFFWNSDCLLLTQEGKQSVSSLYSHVFTEEHQVPRCFKWVA